VKGWKVWQRNRSKHQRREELRGVKAATAAGTVARGAKVAQVVGQAPVFPQEEGLQVLRREDGLYRLQARGHSVAVRAGAREDSAAANDGRLRAAPALAGRGHQEGAQHRVVAIFWKRGGHAGAARGSAGGGPCRAVAWNASTGCSARSRSAKGVNPRGADP